MSLITEAMTIQLPAATAHRLHRVARLSHREVDDVLTETLQTTLPPLLEDVPLASREALADLEDEPTTALWQQMVATFDPTLLERYDELLEANAARELNKREQQELTTLRQQADLLMYRKAYAAQLLKLRGEPIPTLAELEG